MKLLLLLMMMMTVTMAMMMMMTMMIVTTLPPAHSFNRGLRPERASCLPLPSCSCVPPLSLERARSGAPLRSSSELTAPLGRCAPACLFPAIFFVTGGGGQVFSDVRILPREEEAALSEEERTASMKKNAHTGKPITSPKTSLVPSLDERRQRQSCALNVVFDVPSSRRVALANLPNFLSPHSFGSLCFCGSPGAPPRAPRGRASPP